MRQLERKPDGTLDAFQAVFKMSPGEWGEKGRTFAAAPSSNPVPT